MKNSAKTNETTVAPGWAAIFDVDGTMVPNLSHHREAWIQFGRRHGLPITEAYYRDHIHARSNPHIVATLSGDFAWKPAHSRVVQDEKEAIYRELYRPHLKEIPGLTPLLRDLQAHSVPCAAVSNSPQGNVDMVLDELGIRDCFRFILTADGIDRGKPDPAAFFKAAEALGVPIHRCVVFEDSPSGFQAAERAGAPYVVISADAEPAALRQARLAVRVEPDFTRFSLDDLAAIACVPAPAQTIPMML